MIAAEISPPDVKSRARSKLVGAASALPGARASSGWPRLAQQNFHGLLADDMGLGKTLQALALCAWLRATEASRAPGPRRLPDQPRRPTGCAKRRGSRRSLRTLDLTGADRAERFAQRRSSTICWSPPTRFLRRDIEHYRADEFSLVILDEAQHIKNRGSQNAQSAKALRARHRLILTGTPLENSVLDLWSLFDFLLPGYLGTAADFRERYETPLSRGADPPRSMERLRHRVRPFFLRRTKEEVLHGPAAEAGAPDALRTERRAARSLSRRARAGPPRGLRACRAKRRRAGTASRC